MEGVPMNIVRHHCNGCKSDESLAKRLFAEHLVSYTLMINGHDVRISSDVSLRPAVYLGFSHCMAMTVVYLDRVLKGEVVSNISLLHQRGYMTPGGFEWYSRNLISNFMIQRQNTQSILRTCVQIALTAVLYYEQGITAAPFIAINVIVNALNLDLSRGGWQMLQNAAEEFERMEYSVRDMPSPSSESRESSEDYQSSDGLQSSDGHQSPEGHRSPSGDRSPALNQSPVLHQSPGSSQSPGGHQSSVHHLSPGNQLSPGGHLRPHNPSPGGNLAGPSH